MKNILVPCDFSAASGHALRFALEIASLNQGQVTVLHVINLTPNYIETLEMNPYYVNSMSILAELRQQSLAHFDQLSRKLNADDRTLKLVVEQGIISQAILKSIHQLNIDLVVMATSGAT